MSEPSVPRDPSEKPTLDDWRALAAKDLKGADPDTLVWHTPEGIDVKPLYTGADLAGIEGLDSLPGFPPFTRGVRATTTRSSAVRWSAMTLAMVAASSGSAGPSGFNSTCSIVQRGRPAASRVSHASDTCEFHDPE